MSLHYLERKGTIALILAMPQQPTRFRDLKRVLPREGTLSRRLRELEDLQIIETEPVQDGRRKYFGYKLTDKGIKIQAKIKEIELVQ